jgi:uncharacterized protein YndB with AHSA1/START domain
MTESSSSPEMVHGEFTITRILDAPRELVWKAWTDPEHLSRWWGPRGLSTPVSTIELDPRPGGVFRFTMVSDSDGTEYPSDMTFREVVEPERIVFAWEEQRGIGAGEVTVTFTDLGDKTEMTTHYAGWNTEQMHGASNAGWKSQFERLEELLAQA